MNKKTTKRISSNLHLPPAKKRYSDQTEYYIDYLKIQKKSVNNKFSILGQHHKHLNDFIQKEILALPKGATVLDAGCGLSTWVTPQIRKKYDITGVDGEPDSIEACKKIYKGEKYFVADLYNLKMKPNQFDAVVMREVIEHFITPEKAVNEIYKVLKKGGIFVLTTPNYTSPLLHVIEHTYNRFFGGPCKPYLPDVHPSKFTPTTLRNVLSKKFEVHELQLIDLKISMGCIAIKKK